MEKKNLDWANIGFGYIKTDQRYVSNYKAGVWDEGRLTDEDMLTISECAGVLQYAQTIFEGMKAYTTEDGRIVTFRPDLNAARMADSAKRLEMPVFPQERFVEAVLKKICKLVFEWPFPSSVRMTVENNSTLNFACWFFETSSIVSS